MFIILAAWLYLAAHATIGTATAHDAPVPIVQPEPQP